VYTIPLRSAWVNTRRIARTNKSVSTVRRFIERHMHAKTVKISAKVNEALWSSGAKKPPGKIRIKAILDEEGIASVKMPGEITLEEEKKKFLDKKPAEGKEEPTKAADTEKAEKEESKEEIKEPEEEQVKSVESTESPEKKDK
jgi:ribosomal protein L31E